MPGLTYALKTDGTQLEKGLNNAKQSVNKFQNDVSAMEKKAARERQMLQQASSKETRLNSMKFGMGAMQVQDIAVGIQGGQKAATIVMQQGTQLLSMFGPGGAIAGAVLGIGTLLVQSFSNASDEIKKMDEASKGLFKNISENSAQRDIEGLAKNMEDATVKIAEIRKNLDPKLSRVFHTEGSLNEIKDMSRQIDDLKSSQISAEKRILEIANENMEVARLRIAGEEDAADAMETQLKLKREMERIDALPISAKNKEILKAQESEKIQLAQKVKQNKEERDLEKQQEEEARKIGEESVEREKEQQKELQQIAQKQADDEARIREQGAKAFDAAEKVKQDAIEKTFTLDEKLALAKERVKQAQQEALKARGTAGQEMAEAKLSEAQAGLMDVREQKIQRIMGGSTKAAEAARQDKRDARARARAERILDKREAIKAADAKARGEKAAAKVEIKGADKGQEQVTLLGKIEQEMKTLNQKLTVA